MLGTYVIPLTHVSRRSIRLTKDTSTLRVYIWVSIDKITVIVSIS